jgi:hypothetical protein
MMRSHKHFLSVFCLVLLGAIIAHGGDVLGVQAAYAQAGSTVQGQLGEPAVGLMSALGILISFLEVLALIGLWILQYALSTDFLTDPNMLTNLNQIWILSRDIVNLAFALMLIGVAIYTIITAKKELITGKMVHFVTAVILVNFSWFFPRVIIDISNIMTSAVFSIPNMLPNFSCRMPGERATDPDRACRVILDVLILPRSEQTQRLSPNYYCNQVLADPTPVVYCNCLGALACYKEGEFSAAQSLAPGHAMINGLAVSFARITAMAKVPGSAIDPGSGASQNAIVTSLRAMISTIMAAVVLMAAALPLIALAIGMIIRMLILWVCVAFMPFAFLGYAWNGKLGIPEPWPSKYDVWNNFVTAAFLPVIVAVPFAIGFVMLSTTAQIQEPTTGLVFGTPILEGITTWWRLMWQGAAIGIIYTGAFSAMEKNELINSVTGKVKGFGDNIIGAAASAPQLIPIPLPGSAGGNTTVGQLMNRPSQIKQAIQQAGREGKSFKEVFESIKKGTTQQQVLNTQQASKTLQDNATASNNIAKTLGELNGLSGSARDAKLQELIKHMNDANVPNAQRLTSNNVLPELRRIAQHRGNSGTIGGQLSNIENAIKASGTR